MLVFVVLSVIWGTTWSVIKIGLAGAPPLTGLAIRFAIAAAFLLALARWYRIPLGRSALERRLWLVNGLLSFCLSYGVVYWAEQHISSGLAAVIFATYPLFVVVMAHFTFENEKMSKRSVSGVAISLIGVVTIYADGIMSWGGGKQVFASLVLLASPLASAVASVSIKKWGGRMHPISMTAVPMGLAAVMMGVLAAIWERGQPVHFDFPTVASILYLAIFGSALTFSLYFWALSHAAVTELSLIAYTIPVIAVVIGIVFLDEAITTRTMLGVLLVIGGIALSQSR